MGNPTKLPFSSLAFSLFFSNRVQAIVCCHLEGCAVYLELTASGVEAECHHFLWTDPDCTGKDEVPEHLQFISDLTVRGNTAEEVFEKGEKIIQILLKAVFIIKQNKVKGLAQEIQFLGVKWQDGCQQILADVINKITAMSSLIRKKKNKQKPQAFLGVVGFWRIPIPEYNQIVSPLYLVTRRKNCFKWGPEQLQAFEQIKQEITHPVSPWARQDRI